MFLTRLTARSDALADGTVSTENASPAVRRSEIEAFAPPGRPDLNLSGDELKNTKYPFVVDVLQSYEPTKQPFGVLAKPWPKTGQNIVNSVKNQRF
jgi:hypothetical protein